MKVSKGIILLAGVCWAVVLLAVPAYAFLGEYNSNSGNDMALLVTFKSSEVDYEDNYDQDLDIERKVLSFIVSKSINKLIKVYGGFNWGLDGKIEDTGHDLDHSYALTTGGSYTFWDQGVYSISGYGQFEYMIEEEHKNSDINQDVDLDGYELLTGVMGKYNFNQNFSAYGTLEIMLISDYTLDIHGYNSGEVDLEREDSLGFRFGGIYNQPRWFIKGELGIGMDSEFALTGGMKF